MKKTKVLSLILAVAVIISVCTVGFSVSAASGTCGANISWNLTSGTLSLTGSGAMTDFASDDAVPWVKEDVKTVTIASGITSIGNYAFYGCNNLTSVSIPTSVKTIGANAFRYCSSLATVNVPSGVTSIGANAFGWCISLSSLTLPEGLLNIGNGAFYYCNSLSEIKLPSTVKTLGEGSFYACRNIMAVAIPSGVTTIPASAFENCESLATLTLPGTVTSVGDNAFAGCELKDVYFEGSSQASISFGDDTGLGGASWHYSSAPSGDGVTVSGTVKNFGSATEEVTVSIYAGTSTTALKTVKVKGLSAIYSLADIPAGNYKVKFEKATHVARTYDITVSSTAVTLDAQINRFGDINGDGYTDKKDANLYKKHISRASLLKDYQFEVANINGDGYVDKKDSNLVKKHINRSKLLY